jgi:hypothetical protein
MLKIPHPSGEKNGLSLLAIERQGRIYNTSHMRFYLGRKGHKRTPKTGQRFWIRSFE